MISLEMGESFGFFSLLLVSVRKGHQRHLAATERNTKWFLCPVNKNKEKQQ